MMWHTESSRKRAKTMPVEERITLSSPYGVGRAVAEGPELDASLDNAGESSRIAGDDYLRT